jgi:hypothetical protein
MRGSVIMARSRYSVPDVTSSRLLLEPYVAQKLRWPKSGRHVMAQFDDTSVVVYQAYRPAIGHFAAANGYFGGEFSLGRMSWVKPNFLWMMYRCGWATKEGQEVVLAVWLQRAAFDSILEAALTHGDGDVRLQWDPDHGPSGAPAERRAVQLGLRGETLRSYARPWITRIEDVSDLCREQHARWREGGDAALVTPREEPYPVTPAARTALGMDAA